MALNSGTPYMYIIGGTVSPSNRSIRFDNTLFVTLADIPYFHKYNVCASLDTGIFFQTEAATALVKFDGVSTYTVAGNFATSAYTASARNGLVILALYISSVKSFDGTTFATLPGMFYGTYNASASTVGLKTYIFGGDTSGTAGDESDIIQWHDGSTSGQSTVLPYKLVSSTTSVIGSDVFIFGGNNTTEGAYASILVFNGPSQTVTATGISLFNVLYGSCSATIGTTIFTYGGTLGFTNPSVTNTVFKFDKVTVTTVSNSLQATQKSGATTYSSTGLSFT